MREDSADGGLLIVTAEPKELTIVNIAGKISLDQLRQLQGHMVSRIFPALSTVRLHRSWLPPMVRTRSGRILETERGVLIVVGERFGVATEADHGT